MSMSHCSLFNTLEQTPSYADKSHGSKHLTESVLVWISVDVLGLYSNPHLIWCECSLLYWWSQLSALSDLLVSWVAISRGCVPYCLCKLRLWFWLVKSCIVVWLISILMTLGYMSIGQLWGYLLGGVKFFRHGGVLGTWIWLNCPRLNQPYLSGLLTAGSFPKLNCAIWSNA